MNIFLSYVKEVPKNARFEEGVVFIAHNGKRNAVGTRLEGKELVLLARAHGGPESYYKVGVPNEVASELTATHGAGVKVLTEETARKALIAGESDSHEMAKFLKDSKDWSLAEKELGKITFRSPAEKTAFNRDLTAAVREAGKNLEGQQLAQLVRETRLKMQAAQSTRRNAAYGGAYSARKAAGGSFGSGGGSSGGSGERERETPSYGSGAGGEGKTGKEEHDSSEPEEERAEERAREHLSRGGAARDEAAVANEELKEAAVKPKPGSPKRGYSWISGSGWMSKSNRKWIIVAVIVVIIIFLWMSFVK